MGRSVDGREFGAEAVDAAGHSERVNGAITEGPQTGLFSAKQPASQMFH
jgi:hypothetical protein